FIDLTDVAGAQDGTLEDTMLGARELGQRLQAAVREATGLSCSIGITPNKLLSKLCSEFDKPGGITLLDHSELTQRIWPLPAKSVNGIGPKASAKLQSFGIETIGQLAATDPDFLVEHFGNSFGAWLHEAAHGRDDRPVVTYREPKSISRETTFERDLHVRHDRSQLTAIFDALCEKVAGDLVRKRVMGKTIGLKLRFDDFKTVTRDITLPHYTTDAREIRNAAGQCLKRIDLSRRIRLLGVRVGTVLPKEQALLQSQNDVAADTPEQGVLPLFD